MVEAMDLTNSTQTLSIALDRRVKGREMYTRVIQATIRPKRVAVPMDIAGWVVPLLVWFAVLVIFLCLVAGVFKSAG